MNIGDSVYATLRNRFKDADGDTLTYSFKSSNPAIATASLAGNGIDMVIQGSTAIGSTTITVTANDNQGGTVDMVFSVTVAHFTSPPTGDIFVLNTVGVDEIIVYAPKGFTVRLYDTEIGGNLLGEKISESFDDENGRPVKNENGALVYRAAIQVKDVTSVSKVFVSQTEPGKRESIRILVPVTSESRIVTKDKNIVQVNESINFIKVKSTATIGEIKNAIQSKNGSIQSYSFKYNKGDDTTPYIDSDIVSDVYVSWIDVVAEDGITRGQYTIEVIK